MSLKSLLGIDVPIVQAPMAGFQGSALAIAVCNAGGLGSLPCALLDAEQVRSEIAAIRAGTGAPFNLNFFCHAVPTPNEAREAAWRALLAPYYEEFGIDPHTIPAGSARASFDSALAGLVEELRPPIVSFHFGLPVDDLLARVRATGARILSSATTVDEARWLERRGVDAVIAQGTEAGGHRGMFLSNDVHSQIGTFALVPQVVRAVSVPVIAAGGIADASGVRAALALGASGVQVGTAYLLCPEATTAALHRRALSTTAPTTALTNLFTGRLARGIVNRLMRELGPVNAAAPTFPLAAAAIAPVRAAAERAGSEDFSPLWAGQNSSGCREVGAATITRDLAGALAS
ncbi:MAG: nitronate monooxygenase [Cytophagaceae bacterium]|nr:nitronate monooxygenase [Gemmatimonadaceae bacterium]